MTPQLRLACLFAFATSCFACSSSDGDAKKSAGNNNPPQAVQPDAEVTPEAGPEAVPDTGPTLVNFPDPGFESCVRVAVNMSDGDLFPEHLAGLANLECQNRHIASIEGIEHATLLTDLSLFENEIVDISPLKGLTSLRYLQLGHNQIQDITPLAGLTSLRRLGLSINRISSLIPLAGLTSLEWLNLDRNAFGDGELIHLSEMIRLRWLTLEHNGIQDFSALQPALDAGCDLYGKTKSVLRAKAPKLDAAAKFDKVDIHSLKMRIGAKNNVAFSYHGNPVRQTYAGKLQAQGQQLVYTVGGKPIPVGSTRDALPCSGEYESTCRVIVGRKADSSTALPGHAKPVVTVSLELAGNDDAPKKKQSGHLLAGAWGTSDTDLEPLTLASPNQFDAGSCLYMANTGAVELLINQHTPTEQISYGGDTDLSERFLMGVEDFVGNNVINYYLTDLLYSYESVGGSLLNRDYNFCAGYVKETDSGSVTPVDPKDPDAKLSCMYNWFEMFPQDWRSLLVPTPAAERTLIYVDPKRDDSSKWRVGLMDDDTIEQIKSELRTKNAPVIVIYNHYLYWHANVVVGFDDNQPSNGCSMVEDSMKYFNEQGAESYSAKIKKHMDENGGCSDHGVFYVRDSIYDGTDQEPEYDYSTNEANLQKEKYSQRIVKLSYNWAKYLGNHTYTVHRK